LFSQVFEDLVFLAITAIGGLNQKYLEIKPHGLQVIAEQN
jgi:hypothetical protein